MLEPRWRAACPALRVAFVPFYEMNASRRDER